VLSCAVVICTVCLLFSSCRKDDAYYDALAAKAKAAGGDEDVSEMSDADPGQLLREMV